MDKDFPASARLEIDRIDREIAGLIRERMIQVDKIAQWKKLHDQPVFVPEREEEIIRNIRNLTGDFCAGEIEHLYRILFALCRKRQEKFINSEE